MAQPAPADRKSRLGIAPLRAASMALGALPPGAGQHALVRRLYARARHGRAPERHVMQRLRGGARFELWLDDRIQWETFVMRRYEPALVEFLARRLPPAGTMVDVGANVGLVALQVARRRPGAMIHALEPNRTSAGRLTRNLELNPGLHVEVHRLAAGLDPGEATLAWDPSGRDMATSRLVDQEPSSASERVPVVTLDQFVGDLGLDHVDVLKVDVEGHDAAVLAGATTLLRDHRIGVVVYELNDVYLAEQGAGRDELAQRLAEYGYRQIRIPPTGAQRLRPWRRRPAVEDVAFVSDARE